MVMTMIVLSLLTLLVVLIGLVTMVKGGKFNEEHSNKLMRLRVGLQAITLLLLFLLVAGAGA